MYLSDQEERLGLLKTRIISACKLRRSRRSLQALLVDLTVVPNLSSSNPQPGPESVNPRRYIGSLPRDPSWHLTTSTSRKTFIAILDKQATPLSNAPRNNTPFETKQEKKIPITMAPKSRLVGPPAKSASPSFVPWLYSELKAPENSSVVRSVAVFAV